MADHATTGGYAVAATVITADLPVAGQLAPGDWIEFDPCSLGGSRRRASRAGGGAWRSRIRRFPSAMRRRGLASARIRASAPLAPFTTFKVGGPAEWFLETTSADEIVDALRMAHRSGVTVTLLGGGSNVLIGDRGVSGLVIRPQRGHDRAASDATRIRADAPTTINGLVRWTVHRGIAGLEAWAGTPGTVGGAIFGNAHFGGRLIGELVESVRLADSRRIDARSSARATWNSDTIEAACRERARCSCPRCSACRRASRRRCAKSRGSRWRTVSGRSRSRRRAPGAFFRIRMRPTCRMAFRRRRARWSIAPVSRARLGRRARVGRAREFHRQRGARVRRRHSHV